MDLAAVQLHANLVAHVQVQDHAVGGVVVVLVGVLGDGAGPHLETKETRRQEVRVVGQERRTWGEFGLCIYFILFLHFIVCFL